METTIDAGTTPRLAPEAFAETFGRLELPRLEREWRAHVDRLGERR